MRGARAFYDVTEKVKDLFLADIDINTVTFGDITQVDLSKQTIFPLAHMIVNSVVQQGQIYQFNISVICMDIVDINKANTTDLFYGNDNLHDILNTQLAVINRVAEKLRKGNVHQDAYHLDGNVSCDPFYDRFENQLAGFSASFTIIVPNDIDIC